MLTGFLRFSRILLILTVVWVVMQESFSLSTILTGLGVAALALAVTNRLILKESYRGIYSVRLLPALRYGFRLLVAIYVAGIQAVGKMITGKVNVGVVEIETTLDEEFGIALLANSITLTPGTVTLDRDERHLKVIWLDCVTRDPEGAGRSIKGDFETMIRRITR